MAAITFASNGRVQLSTKHHGDVTLSKVKWDIICAQPERFFYRFNSEKVPTVLINPDLVKCHRTEPRQVIYYKSFDTCKINDTTEITVRCKWWAVIVDTKTKRVCTIYPTDKPKPGKEFKGGGA